MKFIIERTYQLDRTEGVMCTEDGKVLFRALELPWKNNHHFISCIPEGTYTCARYTRKNGQVCWELLDVRDRSDILVHIANTVNDLLGCIGIGMAAGTVNGLIGIIMSTIAFKRFMWMTRKEPWIVIEIRSRHAAD